MKCALNVDTRTGGRANQPEEIIGVEGITPKIAVQIEKRSKGESREGVRGMRDTVIEVGLPCTSHRNIYSCSFLGC